MICYVTRYDPDTKRATGTVAVEAETKDAAVQQACGFKVTKAGPKSATASVVCLGDKPKDRQYFRKA